MLLKLVGGAMVVASCSMIGLTVASNFKYRPKTLRNLQTALSMLETEINYGHSQLPEALECIGRKCERDIANLFTATSKYLLSRDGLTVSEAWENSLTNFFNKSYITENDYEILLAFGKYLGSTDKQDQIKNIKLTLTNLKQQETLSIEEKNKNEKLWKYLGVLTGLMIFLLLY